MVLPAPQDSQNTHQLPGRTRKNKIEARRLYRAEANRNAGRTASRKKQGHVQRYNALRDAAQFVSCIADLIPPAATQSWSSMPNERPRLSAWLVRKSGPLCGRRHLLRGAVTRVGRSPENDLVVDDAPVVSAHHLEIRRVGASFWACDLNSTNGTYVNGRRIYQTALEAPCSIELGPNGPQLAFVLEAPRVADLDQTLLTPAPAAGGDPPPLQPRQTSASGAGGDHEDLLSEAVAKARMARYKGIGNQTVEIMREMLDTAIHRTGRKLKTTIGEIGRAHV